jgi:hypothetical protein
MHQEVDADASLPNPEQRSSSPPPSRGGGLEGAGMSNLSLDGAAGGGVGPGAP